MLQDRACGVHAEYDVRCIARSCMIDVVLSQRDDVIVALVTGNVKEMAWIKMAGLGLLPFFSVPRFGGFGSEYCRQDRPSRGIVGHATHTCVAHDAYLQRTPNAESRRAIATLQNAACFFGPAHCKRPPALSRALWAPTAATIRPTAWSTVQRSFGGRGSGAWTYTPTAA
jgi:hypothetical protein